MSSKTPNLFDYATKELSQDAMICWLIAWSGQCKSEAWENEELRRCGIRLVKAMLKKHGRDIEFNDGYTVKILRQKKRIDILARINGRQVLLIEDKTFTKNHNKQLENYYNHVVSGKTDLGKVEQEDLYPIYCKTGNQSLADDCRIEGIKNYKVFNRKDFLDVLDSYEGCNSTLRDFRKHLKELEIQTNSYVQWRPSSRRDSWRAWEGFYRYLECGWAETSRRIGWEYVPIGDFLGFNWGTDRHGGRSLPSDRDAIWPGRKTLLQGLGKRKVQGTTASPEVRLA